MNAFPFPLSLFADQIAWIATRAQDLGISESEVVRDLIRHEMLAEAEYRESLELKNGEAA